VYGSRRTEIIVAPARAWMNAPNRMLLIGGRPQTPETGQTERAKGAGAVIPASITGSTRPTSSLSRHLSFSEERSEIMALSICIVGVAVVSHVR
jgi:hypothetical protein